MAKTFSTRDLDVIGLERLQEYLEHTGWRAAGRYQDKPQTWVYRKHGYEIVFCDATYPDYYLRLTQAIETLAQVEGNSLVRMYLILVLVLDL